MLELKFMRENVEMLKEMLKNRNSNVDMDGRSFCKNKRLRC